MPATRHDEVETKFVIDGELPPPNLTGVAHVAATDARDAAVQPGSAAEAVVRYVNEQVAAIAQADVAVRRDLDDAVHKTRVAIRRLRSTLATFRRLLDPDAAERVRNELRWLGRILGSVRDVEVIRDHLTKALAEQPATLDVEPALARVHETLGRQHDEAHRRAVEAMSSVRYLALIDDLRTVDRWVADNPRAARPAEKELRKHVRRAHRRLTRTIDAALAGDAPTDEQLHEVRKAGKRLRYAGEAVAPVHGTKAARLTSAMQSMQETLGDHQDSVVIRDVVRRLAEDAGAAQESTFVYGRIDAAEESRGHSARAAWNQALRDGAFSPPGWLK